MKHSIISAFSQAILYVPGLRGLTGSVTSSILMMQLEYWFARYPEGFYKFLEAPQKHHPDYTQGDSWTEELAFGKEEFRAAFDRIGVRYSSKSQYDEAKESGQEFGGDKYYCSYYDRQTALTFYFRCSERIEKLASQIQPRIKGTGKKIRKSPSRSDHVGNSDMVAGGFPNFQEIGSDHMIMSEFTTSSCGDLPLPDLYIYSETTKTENTRTERSPLTPQGEETHSQNGTEEINLSEVGDEPEEDHQPETPLPTPQPQKPIPFVQSKNSAQDQTRRASALFFGITTEEYNRIKETYNQHKPEMWQEQKTLYKELKDELRGLIGGEDFGGDIGAFLTRLENALKWVDNDPWWSVRRNMALRDLIRDGRIFKFSDSFTTSQTPTTPNPTDDDDVPEWAKWGVEQAKLQNKAG